MDHTARKESICKSSEDNKPSIEFCSQVDFNVNADSANLNIQSDVVRMMYAKAERLISNNNILPAPGASLSYTSVSHTADFHITIIKENNEALCDCKSFKSLKMW